MPIGGEMGRLTRLLRGRGESSDDIDALRRRVSELEEAVAESRALNERVADVVDVVAELLVPAVDRDDERLRRLLLKIDSPDKPASRPPARGAATPE